jgi:hypothetical protein
VRSVMTVTTEMTAGSAHHVGSLSASGAVEQSLRNAKGACRGTI